MGNDEIIYPKYILLLRGPMYLSKGPDDPWNGRCGVETKAFFTLDEFKQYAEKERIHPNKVVGLYLLGEPLDIDASEKTVEVTEHEWSVPAEEDQ